MKNIQEYVLQPFSGDDILEQIYSILDRTTSGTLPKLQGEVLTVIESIGLPQKQENSIKGLIKTFVNKAIHEVAENQMTLYRKTRDTLIDGKVIKQPDDMAVTLFGQFRSRYFFDEVENPDK